MKKCWISLLVLVVVLVCLVSSIAVADVDTKVNAGASWADASRSTSLGAITTLKADGYKAVIEVDYNVSRDSGITKFDEIRTQARLDRVFSWGYWYTEFGWRQEEIAGVEYSRLSSGAGRHLILKGLFAEAGLTMQNSGVRETVGKAGLKYKTILFGRGVEASSNYYVGGEDDDYDISGKITHKVSENVAIVFKERYERTQGIGSNIGSVGLEWSF